MQKSHPRAEFSSSVVPSASKTTSSLGLRSPVKVADVPVMYNQVNLLSIINEGNLFTVIKR